MGGMAMQAHRHSPLGRQRKLSLKWTAGPLARVQRHGRRNGQKGFALMVVLFVLLLTSLLVVALVGLSFSTAVFSGDQSIRDNRARAADAALQTSINEIARDPTGNLGFPYKLTGTGEVVDNTDCSTGRDFKVGQPEVKVVVQCVPVTPEQSAAGDGSVTGGLVGTDSRDMVRVIGETNHGDQATKWKNNWPWSSTLVDNPESPATESYAAAQAAINAYNPTLLHRGSEPLSFTSGVEVSQGAAALRDPVLAEPNGFDSAINVSGGYWQGLPGLLNGTAKQLTDTEIYSDKELSNTCGLLQPVNSNWQIWGAAVRTGSSLACDQSGKSNDARNSLNTNWQTSGVAPGAPYVSSLPIQWTPDEITYYKRSAPACPPAGGTANFQPGSYNRLETAKIKAMWAGSGGGSCPGRTWVFEPGQYWMDVAPSNPTNEAERNALVINDPNAKIIFGEPSEIPVTAASFPNACDPDQPGVVLTLSPRTSIRHKRGRVAMCGAQTQEGRQAVWQSSGANLGWVAGPSDSTGVGGDFATNPDGALVLGDGNVAQAFWPCWSPLLQGWINDTPCSGPRELTISGLGADDDAGASPVPSLQVLVSARALSSNARGANVRFVIRPSADRGGGQCTMSYSPLPDNFELYAYELMNPLGSCHTLIKSRSQLVGATISAYFYLEPTCTFICWTESASLQVDYMGIRVPWTPTPESVGFSGASAYENAGNAAKLDNNFAKRRVNCDGWFFPWLTCNSNTTAVLELTNLQDLSSPDLTGTAAAGTALKSLYVVVTGYAENVDLGSSRTILTVKRPNGTTLCSAQYRGVPGGTSRYGPVPQAYDLTKPANAGGNCNTQITSASQLVGASLQVYNTLAKTSDCSAILTWIGYRDCSGWGNYIDHVSVSTTSAVTGPDGQPSSQDTYQGPTSPYLVTSNNAPGTNNDAVFSALGQFSAPRADLDIHWDGPAAISLANLPSAGSVSITPLFSGTGSYAMTVNSINSSGSGKVGVVCCKPAKPTEREVDLIVRLGSATGSVIATARVLFFDVSTSPASAGTWAPGQRVTVQDWRSCPAGVSSPSVCSTT